MALGKPPQVAGFNPHPSGMTGATPVVDGVIGDGPLMFQSSPVGDDGCDSIFLKNRKMEYETIFCAKFS